MQYTKQLTNASMATQYIETVIQPFYIYLREINYKVLQPKDALSPQQEEWLITTLSQLYEVEQANYNEEQYKNWQNILQ